MNETTIPRRRYLGQTQDAELGWITKLYGEAMEDWRQLAARYMAHVNAGAGRNFSSRLAGVRTLLEYYLYRHGFTDPQSFLSLPRNAALPPLFGPVGQGAFRKSRTGIKTFNCAHDFLQWVLENDDRFSEEDDGGRTVLPGYRVPFPRQSQATLPHPSQSVRTPLPYKLLVELRQMVAPGRHFKDWAWAHNATGRNHGETSGDWYEVDPSVIDKSDPDCVWRETQVNTYAPSKSRGKPEVVRKWINGKLTNVTRTAYEKRIGTQSLGLGLILLHVPTCQHHNGQVFEQRLLTSPS